MKLPQLALSGCLLVSIALIVQADQFGDFTYTTNDAGITITGYTGTGGAVAIPGTIEGVPVTRIGDLLFAFNTNITSITIPENVTGIDAEVFARCVNLRSVSIPNGVTNIGTGAFYYCLSLTSLTIPATVSNIGVRAFASCTNLQGVFFKGSAPKATTVFYFTDTVSAYYLPGITGWTNTFGGRPAVLWNPLAQTGDGSFGMGTNGFGFNITGTTNIPIVVEAAPDVVGGHWVPLLTNTIATGSVYFSDPDWTNRPARFYRIRSP